MLLAAADFTIACKLDYDEETNVFLEMVQLKVQKIMENHRKYEQKRELKVIQKKLEKELPWKSKRESRENSILGMK